MQHSSDQYIHGSEPIEQARLTLLNEILNEECLQQLQLQGHERILDIGSGLGHFSRAMARVAGESGFVLGVERDAAQLQAAEEYARQAGEQGLVEFRAGNAYDLPLSPGEEESFDVVHCRFVLEHLQRPGDAVMEMTRAAGQGGRIVLIDDDHSLYRMHPDCTEMKTLWEAYCKSYEMIGNDPWIGRKLVSLLNDAGITAIRQDTIFFGSWRGDSRFQMYVDNIAGILNGARPVLEKHNLLSTQDTDQALAAFESWSRRDDAAIWYPLNVAIGIK